MCETNNDDSPIFISAETMNEIIELMRICAVVLLGCNEDNKAELKDQLHEVLEFLNKDEG